MNMAVSEEETAKKQLKRLVKIDELQYQSEKQHQKSKIYATLAVFPMLTYLLTLALIGTTEASGEKLDIYTSCGACSFLIGGILFLISWNYSGQRRKSQKSIKFQRRMRDKYD